MGVKYLPFSYKEKWHKKTKVISLLYLFKKKLHTDRTNRIYVILTPTKYRYYTFLLSRLEITIQKKKKKKEQRSNDKADTISRDLEKCFMRTSRLPDYDWGRGSIKSMIKK